ncbi:hypothetical protein [Hazenella coriacea]|uniref:Uncharacterized protein n=1 Tax=Hazenella coriacea TaxID=1179467 RepID=A0A4R3L1H4_9BACL|nr:hypothetical protein [Hazenella coriacea]TCS92224.1 hypothetical protein EDD58_11415 [Hazenella coriacea]
MKIRITIDVTLEHSEWLKNETTERSISRNKLIELALDHYKKYLEEQKEG